MCGISGAVSFTQQGTRFLSRVQSANDTLQKRGPDGGDVFTTERAALGHRRLSIIDVSCAGDQPMRSANGRFTIVFNGEIFNYQELKDRYLTEEERAALRSHSDTEVFLQLYTRLGVEVFKLLQGFFAAAISDQETGEVVLVRDRYGKKPLLYFQDEDKLLFASEMKALFAAGVPREVNWEMLPVYFRLNYVPQPYSLVKGVRKLKPGSFLRITRTGVEEGCYYELKTRPQDYGQYTYDQAKGKLVHLMDDAVRMRLISDVPLGAFLSGGIDSSVVVALASRHTTRLRTFSIGYKDNPYFDETSYANLVAKKYGTEHTVFSLTNNDFLEHVHDVMDYIDEPFADSSAIPQYILSYHTRKHVTVALSGDGGDEVFAGYHKHGAEWRMRQGGMLNTLVNAGAPLWSVLPKSRNNKFTNKFRQLNRFAQGARLETAQRYWEWATLASRDEATRLLSPAIRQKVNGELEQRIQNDFTATIRTSDFNEVLLTDMNLVLLSDMLVKVDLMSMANSLEVRSPFLDQNVVEFAFGLPAEYKIDSKLKKRIVQDAFREYLPEELYNRPKRGFEIPLLQWFRKELWGLINDDLLNDAFVREQGIFDPEAIRQLKARIHSADPGDSHATIWALLVFQHWWKRYIAAGA
jgi:asparagine synthase (glutamine-hydrolysing)